MRALGLTDTIFYNLRDSQITAVAALDGPCDLARLLAEIEGVVAAAPGYAEAPVRIGPWFFARAPAPVNVAERVAVIRDPAITAPEQLAPLLDRIRRNRIAVAGPQWRAFVLNPAGTVGNGGPPLSAVFFQQRHGLADGMRTVQALSRMARFNPSAAHVAGAARIATATADSFPADIAIHDAGPSLLLVPRRGLTRETDASVALALATVGAVEDVTLFPHAHPLRGSVGRTRFVRRRGAAAGVGNSLRMETIARRPASGRKRLRIPGLARAQDLQISQWAVALAPPPLAKLMMRIWYANFDAIATLIPIPRRFRIGGRAVRGFFAAPPLWGPVPLAVIAFADGEHYYLTVYPGRGFAADRTALHRKLLDLLLNPGRESTAEPRAD